MKGVLMDSHELLNALDKKIDDVLKILNGNGTIGMCAQVEINKSDIDGIKKTPDTTGKWLVRGVQFITLAVLIYITFFK